MELLVKKKKEKRSENEEFEGYLSPFPPPKKKKTHKEN